jgi:hypothetical protein
MSPGSGARNSECEEERFVFIRVIRDQVFSELMDRVIYVAAEEVSCCAGTYAGVCRDVRMSAAAA